MSMAFMGPIAALLAASAFPMPLGPDPDRNHDPVSEAEAPDIVDIDQDRTFRMTVPVSIGGHGPFNFMIDTGSERTIVSRSIAGTLGLEFAERATVMGVAGSTVVDTVFVPDLTLGKRNYGEVVAPLLDPFHIGADGILGLDGLQDQRVLFDFRKNLIAIERVGQRGARNEYEIGVTARGRSGQLIFSNATIGGQKVEVIIDTGAESNIGNRALQKLLARRGATSEQTSLLSVTGQSIDADVAIGENFRMGRLKIDRIGLVFADAPPFKEFGLEKRPALLLGMGLLRQFDRMAIDFKNRRVLFDLPPES